ncbi:MAG: SulP family inorganic anion transporter [Herminiimonas sp.]|nr:SulP family inorganic anion transporter [Herminiimonas sp.]
MPNMWAIKRLFPFLYWRRPTLATLRRDAWAGLSVGLVLIPQALAYATLAGMPPETGLYAALVPAVIGILWGSSALLAVGPVALTSLLTFGSLAPLAAPGSAHWVVLAMWLALYAGMIQFAIGALRLGEIASLVSQPVVLGFINAAAIIIVVSQLPALMGITLTFSLAHPLVAVELTPATVMTSVLGAASLLLLFMLKRLTPRLPGMLIVSALAILVSWLTGYALHGGAIVGPVSAGLPPLAVPPAISFAEHQSLWPAALVLALISFTEAMSSCRVLARKTGERWDVNQELVGQGLAKIASGFSGAFPVSGSFSRSALNLYAGAVSAWSTLFSALCVLLSLFYLTGLIAYLPRTVLASMIILPVLSLIDFGALRRLVLLSKDDGAIAITTFVVTLMMAPRLQWGVFVGVGLSLLSFLYRRTHPRIVEVGIHQDETFRDRSRFTLPLISNELLAVRLDSALNFLTVSCFERFVIDRCSQNPGIKKVLFCAGSVNDIDASGIDMLIALQHALERDGIELYMCAVKKQVWEVMARSPFVDALGIERVFATDKQAMHVLRGVPARVIFTSGE